MIDETLQDQAALHALGLLEGGEAAAFQAALAGQAELQTMVNELADAAASIAHALPAAQAPTEVLPRLLAQIRAERLHGAAPQAQVAETEAGWMPWAVAASIALAAAVGFLSGAKVSAVRSDVELARLRSQIDQADTERLRLATIIAALKEERVAMEKHVDSLRTRDAISQVQIATLKVQATALARAYAEVAAYVVWDANGQNGVMRFDRLPPAGVNKDYQMWIIDPRYDAPVSAGIFSAGTGGELEVKFKPTRPIALAGKFALSVEQRGGSAKPQGPIVLMSN